VIKTSTLVIAVLVIIVLVLAGFILKDVISINVAGEDDQEQTEETTTGSESETTTAAGGTTATPTTTAAGTTAASTTASTTTTTNATTASTTTTTTTTTTATTAGKPDLTLTSGGLVDMFVLPGETITISGWTVRNEGTVASGDFSNGFYISNDSIITTEDTNLTGNSNTSLAPGGQFVWGDTTLTIPASTPPGSYHIGILVDRNNAVSESNENNNYWSTVIVVEAGP
jgi:subtilase family serine protease